jgi:hypothetical protein
VENPKLATGRLTVSVGKTPVKPPLALGAAAALSELPMEPLLEAVGARVADPMHDGIAEANIMWAAEPNFDHPSPKWPLITRNGVDPRF